MTNATPETIFALIVGIDDYPINPLYGCVNDALTIGAFFDQYAARNAYRRQFKYLLAPHGEAIPPTSCTNATKDELPTRRNIIAAFQDFCHAPMRQGDVFLFYFSGHGSQENAAPEFRHMKPDGMNEAFDCFPDESAERRHIVDKELAWLLWQLHRRHPEVHILTVTDCCHSGNNTRNTGDTIVVRRSKPRMEATPFNRLLGVEGIPESDRIFSLRDGKAYYSREARHFHLAAARDNETAKEIIIDGRRRGVFTWSLLRVLEQGGIGTSYREVLRRTEALVRNRVVEQVPQLEAIGGADGMEGFLGGVFPPGKPQYPVQYIAHEWRLLAGRLHGVVAGSDRLPAFAKLQDGRRVAVREVSVNYAVLEETDFVPDDRDNPDLRATIDQMPAPKIRVWVEATDAAQQALQTAIDNIQPQYVDFVSAAGSEAEFDARRDEQGDWVLLRRESAFPVFLRQSRADQFVQFCDVVGKYRFTLELENATSRIDWNNIDIEMEVIEGQALTPDNLNTVQGRLVSRDNITLHYRSAAGGKWLQPALRCKLRSKQASLWVGGLFLDNEYGITHNLTDRQLLPGQEHGFIFSLGGIEYNAIPLSIKPELLRRGVTEITDYLKIFVSTVDFKLDDFVQEALPLDFSGVPRSIGLEVAAVGTKPDWAVMTIPVKIVYPAAAIPAAEWTMQDFSIVSPAGFKAKYALSSVADVYRKLNSTPLERSEAAALNKYLLPPTSLWGEIPAESQVFGRAPALRSGTDTVPSILELVGTEGNLETPLVLRLREKTAENEAIVAIGYDPVTELYLPLGFTNTAGDVEVFALPPETPGQIFGHADFSERSIKRSVKLFFRKIIRGEPENTLSLVQSDLSVVTDRDAIRAGIASARNILLLTHGIFGNTEDKKVAVMQATDIYQHYDAVLCYDYENLNTDLRETARDLLRQLKTAGACAGDQPRLTIVAPSIGGLVCRWMIEMEGGASYVRHLLLVATPNLGTELARFRQRLFGLMGKALNGASLLKPYLLPLSFLAKKADKIVWRTLDDLHPTHSRFLIELNAVGEKTARVRYSVLGGNLEDATLPDGENYWGRLKKFAIKTSLDWLIFEGPHDMAVEVNSQKGIRGLQPKDTCIVPVDHLGYFTERAGLEALRRLLVTES